MNILMTICGRAGSKGVKNKNLRNFLGIPLVNYTIASAQLFKKRNSHDKIDICLNSDSKELLDLAVQKKDLFCIERPIALAQDHSPKVPVIRYSLEHMERKLNKTYDFVIDLDITSPLRKAEDIENALLTAQANRNADVVFSVVDSRRNPYFNMVEKIEGKIQKVKAGEFVARQQAPKIYDMNASIYCYKRSSLLNVLENSPLDGICDIIQMKDTAILDIDSEEDFELLQILAKYFFENEFKELYRYVQSF